MTANQRHYRRHMNAEALIKAAPQTVAQRKCERRRDRRGLDNEQGYQQCPGKHQGAIAVLPFFPIVKKNSRKRKENTQNEHKEEEWLCGLQRPRWSSQNTECQEGEADAS